MSKWRIYLLGFITLVGFPIPAFLWLNYVENWDIATFLQLEKLQLEPILFGLQAGFIYAAFAVVLLSSDFLKDERTNQSKLLKKLNLNAFDMIFLSICAGVGEELLFRIGIQFYLGPIITTLIFVGLHGYYSLKNWAINVYGILITPFILILAYGLDTFGLWFCIAAHTMYDVVLFFTYAKKVAPK